MRTDLDRFDLIVVGCGPAGATAAKVAAGQGLDVMIIDRRRSVGVPPRCSGYVPEWLRPHVDFDQGAILEEVAGVWYFGREARRTEVPAPGYVLDRTRFDKTLAIHALEAGADLANASVLRREGHRVVVRRNGREAEFEGRFIVGADGPNSVIGRSVGRGNTPCLATLQYEVGLRNRERWCEFHAPTDRDGSAGWVVPCGRTARVGVAVPKSSARSLKLRLAEFLGRLIDDGRVYADAILESTGGLVPAGASLGPLREGPVLLAGAAGGISQPFGGYGIASAVASGRIAGQTVAQAVLNDDDASACGYASKIRAGCPDTFGHPIESAGSVGRRLACLGNWFSGQLAS